MMAKLTDKLPEGKQWTYEVKWDGYRALLLKSGDRVRLLSRKENDLTATYPTIEAAGSKLRAKTAVKPTLVAQIRFVEWTNDGHLRHAAFLGLRSDKRASEVRREA